MGNANFKSCCTNDYSQSKKEVEWGHNQSYDQNDGRVTQKKVTRKIESSDTFDLPFKKPESLNFEIDRKPYSRYADRVKYLEEIVERAPKLILKIINSTTLAKGTYIKIDAQGAEGSLRGKKDGITYFGCKKKSKPMNENFETAEIINDVVIRNKDADTNNRHRGRHFQIEFCLDTNTYKIRDLGIGFGAFTKIDHPLILKDNNLLSMGSSFLIINFSDEFRESLAYSNSQEPEDQRTAKKIQINSSSPFNEMLQSSSVNKEDKPAKRPELNSSTVPDITVKIFGGPNYGEVYQFNSVTNPIIKIGRMPDCEIRIEDNLLSKYQGTIKYIPSSGWTLFDGFNSKASTNSNWLYLNDDFEMYNFMVFKANHTLFEVNIEP